MFCTAIDGPVPSGSGLDQAARAASLVGFEVRGRIAGLGVVAAPASADDLPGAPELVVIGGRSSLLHFHIPLERVTNVSRRTRTLKVDVDVIDFTPRIADDGTVELHITA